MTINDRQRRAFEHVRRWPFSFGVQFFFMLVGVTTLINYLGEYFGLYEPTGVPRLAISAAMGAVLFTVIMRRWART